MTCWAIIPVKEPGAAKQRLTEVLEPGERLVLARAMLAHVADTVQAARNVDRVCLLGPSRQGLDDNIPLLKDIGGGLNPALQAAFSAVQGEKLDRVIIVHADLPKLSVLDIELLAAAPIGTIAIATDRHGAGTNALSLPLPLAKHFTFAFGPDSFALHNAEAVRLGLKIEAIHSEGLARDIDEPDDLPDAMELMDKKD